MTERIYLACNSGDGFVNWFDLVLPNNYVYVIKGGSGVGKSTLMKALVAAADPDERILTVPCSSDSRSLDMAVFPERGFAVVDGTAPHAMDPLCYGADSEIIDLGKYIGKSKLARDSAMIREKTEQKSVLYRLMYSHLRSAAARLKNIDAMYGDSSEAELIREILSEFIADADEPAYPMKGFAESFTENGYAFCHDIVKNRVIVKVKSPCKTKSLGFMTLLNSSVKALGMRADEYYSALFPTEVLAIGTKSALITAADIDGDYEYTLETAADRKYLVHLIEERSAFAGELARAGEYYLEARKTHGEIEAAYHEAMQFTRMERDRERLIPQILERHARR